ncbi:MAG: hypothetical protein ACRDRB_18795 [Pseudonocardiaceae bacterium]
MTFTGPEQKFGIQVQSRKAPRTFEQNVSMILSSIYFVGGAGPGYRVDVRDRRPDSWAAA